MTDWRNLSQKANKLTLESAGGYLVCVEGGKTNRVSATRSRPGPWEILEMIANPGQASKQNKQRNHNKDQNEGDLETRLAALQFLILANGALHPLNVTEHSTFDIAPDI